MKRAFVVVGMHRSGTSAMSRTLSLLGAALPSGLMPAAPDNNETGFWEPKSIADLNDEILETLDSEWDDVFAFRPPRYLSNFDNFYFGRAVELLAREFNGSELIVLKDPRISVLTKFWDRALREAGYAIKYILMVRNPLEVAESLRARDGFPREKSLLLWSSYMIASDRDTRDRDRIFVSYNQLMKDWRSVHRRIEESAGFPFPRDTAAAANEIDRYLNRRLRHHELDAQELFSRPDVSEEVKTLYRVYDGACEGAEVDRTVVDQIENALTKMDSTVGPLLADLRARVRGLARDAAAAAERACALEQELGSERSLRQEQADAAARALAELEQKLAEAASRDHESEAERDRLTGEIERLRGELEQVISRLPVLETERANLAAELEEIRRDGAQREAELNAALAETAATQIERASLAAELEETRRERARREAELNAALEAALAETAAIEIERASLTTELEKSRRERARREEQLGAALRAALDGKAAAESQLGDRSMEVTVLARDLEHSRAAAAQASQMLARRERELSDELDQARAENELAAARLDERFREIATLTSLLGDSEASAGKSREQAGWLQEVSSVLLPGSMSLRARLRRLLPAALYYKRQRQLLKRKGLFDADAYLAANPDVAASGADPLLHYLRHGMAEERQRG